MLRFLQQKCRVFVERNMKPALDSLMASWSPPRTAVKTDGVAPAHMSSVLRQQVRCYSKKPAASVPNSDDDNCGAPKECGTEKKEGSKSCGPAHFKGAICDMVKGTKAKKAAAADKPKAKAKPKAKKFVSMWDIPGCEYVPKCDVPVRLDIAHYRITDKEDRKYQVTWNECPRLLIKPKKVCIHQKHPRPARCRRQRKSAAAKATARPPMPMLNPMKCKEADKSTCPHWTLPCCKPSRIPPSCHRVRLVTDCKKRMAPYPSFSECKRDELMESPPIECLCQRTPMACEVWAEVRRRIARGRDPVLKCGEV